MDGATGRPLTVVSMESAPSETCGFAGLPAAFQSRPWLVRRPARRTSAGGWDRAGFMHLLRAQRAVDRGHAAVFVDERDAVALGQVLGCEADLERLDVVQQVLRLVGPGDDRERGWARQQPRQRELGQGPAALPG